MNFIYIYNSQMTFNTLYNLNKTLFFNKNCIEIAI